MKKPSLKDFTDLGKYYQALQAHKDHERREQLAKMEEERSNAEQVAANLLLKKYRQAFDLLDTTEGITYAFNLRSVKETPELLIFDERMLENNYNEPIAQIKTNFRQNEFHFYSVVVGGSCEAHHTSERLISAILFECGQQLAHIAESIATHGYEQHMKII